MRAASSGAAVGGLEDFSDEVLQVVGGDEVGVGGEVHSVGSDPAMWAGWKEGRKNGSTQRHRGRLRRQEEGQIS